MNLPIVLLPEARAEFDNAVDWYDRQRAGLGQQFIDCVNDVFHRISNTPEIHPKTYKDVRKAIVRRFPYIVLYKAEVNRIVVTAVFHTRRNPNDWKNRI